MRETGPAPAGARQDLLGDWREIVIDSKYAAPAVAEVVDLSAKVDASGRLAWDAPQGRWTLLRFSCAVLADVPRDVDILNAGAVTRHFERFAGPLLKAAGPPRR